MKTLSTLRALAALLLLTLTLGATVPEAQAPDLLPPLSRVDRTALVQQLREYATGSVYWGQLYATTPNERAYWNGKADAFNAAAFWLETLPWAETPDAGTAQQPQPAGRLQARQN